MRVTPYTVWRVLKEAAWGWVEDRAASLGAALAFYTLFSLGPVLLLVIAVAGLAFGEEAARGALVAEFRTLMGGTAAQAVESLIESAGQGERDWRATLVGVTTLLIAATTVFAELQADLNLIWRAEPPATSTVWSIARTRLLGLGLILGIGFLLFVSLAASAALTALDGFLARNWPGLGVLLRGLNLALSFGLTAALFALIYRTLPDVRLEWRDVWFGAVVTAALFTAGKFVIGLYLGSSRIASAYGAAGALVLVVLWVYYAAQILLFGAEITRAVVRLHRKEPRPA